MSTHLNDVQHSENVHQNDTSSTTHFGYQTIDVNDKQKKVGEVFHSVAAKYDLMNDLMSAGIHRLWKQYTIQRSGARKGQTILDLAGGTGDLTSQFSRIVGPQGAVHLSDINASMLSTGRDKLTDQGQVENIHYTLANAEYLPFSDNTFDVITIGFGLRNVTYKDKALNAMYRCLKPGGRLLILEFSKPTNEWFEKFYDFYSFHILPKIGSIVTRDENSYRYLAESIRMHPDQPTLQQMAIEAGFDECDYTNLTGGIVALHIAHKY
ncbi:MAG: bifunctional demethylmenaquinone methyltransferase/2-methoxy-6-polyprenyl-1,4-benzoquinol methylase UbiE [Pseudomonadota bacterium]